jgi:hypothetical protein
MPKNTLPKKVEANSNQVYIWDVITPTESSLNHTKNNNTSESRIKDVQVNIGFLWLESIVIGIVGRGLIEIPETQKLELMRECVELFMDFSYNYITDKYSADEAESLRLMFYPNLPSIQRFQVESLFWEAYQEFLKLLN